MLYHAIDSTSVPLEYTSAPVRVVGSGGKEVEGMMVAGSVGTKFESKEGGEGLEGMSVADGWWMFLKKAAEGSAS